MRVRTSKWHWHLALIVAVGVVGTVAWYAAAVNSAAEVPRGVANQAVPAKHGDKGDKAVRVTTIKPEQGGIERTTNQPGSVIAFESAHLYSKASGYLKSQSVDIGDRVKRGQVLAVVDAPERISDVHVAQAMLVQTEAQVKQAEARVASEQAAHEAAVSAIAQAEAELGHTQAVRDFRDKQYHRIKDLFDLKSIDERLVDEKLDQWESARAGHQAALAAVSTSKAMAAAAFARVAQAKSDLAEAHAHVEVAQAELAKAKVLASYLEIKSPFDGVVTVRNYFPGDFVREASTGGYVPEISQQLLGVAPLTWFASWFRFRTRMFL